MKESVRGHAAQPYGQRIGGPPAQLGHRHIRSVTTVLVAVGDELQAEFNRFAQPKVELHPQQGIAAAITAFGAAGSLGLVIDYVVGRVAAEAGKAGRTEAAEMGVEGSSRRTGNQQNANYE